MSTVVPSLRLKWIREGVEDYEYVEMLKRLGYGDAALTAIQSIAADWSHWSQDVSELEAVRLELGTTLETAATHAAQVACVLYGCTSPTYESELPQTSMSMER
jgi:hypothetical protein